MALRRSDIRRGGLLVVLSTMVGLYSGWLWPYLGLDQIQTKRFAAPPDSTIVEPNPSEADVKKSQVLLVNIADEKGVGQSVVDRRTIARVIRKLTELEATVIGLDIEFVHPTSNDPAQDVELAAAIRDSKRVILPYSIDRLFREQLPCCGFANEARALGVALIRVSNAAGDGLVRTIQHIYAENPQATPRYSLSLELARYAMNGRPHVEPATVRVSGDSIFLEPPGVQPDSPTIEIPLEEDGATLSQYLGPAWTIPTVDYRKILAASLPQRTGETKPPGSLSFDLGGRAVLVGNTRLDIQDAYPMPFYRELNCKLSGVEIHAQNLASLLKAERRAGRSKALIRSARPMTQILIVFLTALAALILVLYLPMFWTVGACAGGMAILWIGAFASLEVNAVYIDPVSPSFSLLCSIGLSIVWLYARERMQRRRIEHLMETYFQPDLVVAATGPAPEGVSDLVSTLLKSKEVLAPPGIEIEGPLGTGGMSVVLAAREKATGRELALKLLSPSLLADTECRARFDREARLAPALCHQNVVGVVSSGHRWGIPFIAYERVHGVSLRTLLERETRLPWSKAVAVIRQVLLGLEAAHVRGIIHRDIKPENVILTTDGLARILDFGIARTQRADEVFRTRTNIILGTPAYIAPEVVRGNAATPASDVYSTGIMLYELIVGGPPFGSDSVSAMLVAHIEKRPMSPREFGVDLPRSLETVLMSFLEKDPGCRPASAMAARELLLPFETSVPVIGEDLISPQESISTQRTMAVRDSSASIHGTVQITSSSQTALPLEERKPQPTPQHGPSATRKETT